MRRMALSTRLRVAPLVALAALAVSASASASAAAPAWKLLAATGPTNLSPRQSEVQRLTVDGAAGTFTLTFQGQTTPALAFDAAPATVEGALDALSTVGGAGGSVSVTGGPGGEAEHPYLIAFGGSLAEANVEQLTAAGSGLGAGGYVNVSTTVPGGPGTGEIGIFPTNVGGAPTGGEITVELTLPPVGIVTAGPAKEETNGTEALWSCVTGASSVKCTSPERAPALSPLASIRVPIEVQAAAAFSSQAAVTISGGGAQPVTYQLPIVVSTQPAPAGIAAFFSGIFDADGKPATQAGGHPYSQVTAFQLNSRREPSGKTVPSGDLKNVNVDLQPGFVGDPLVTTRCPQGLPVPIPLQSAPACSESESERYAVGRIYPGVTVFGNVDATLTLSTPFYNDVPVPGAAAEFSTKVAVPDTTLLGALRSEEDFGIRVEAPNTGLFRGVFFVYTAFFGEPPGAGGKAFFRNATDCAEQARQAPVQSFEASTWEEPTVFAKVSEQLPPVTGCDKLHFEPQFSFQPTSTQGSSGSGATAHLHFDQSGLTDPNKLAQPDLKTSVVTLPQGLDLNPAQANGLEACSEAQIGYKGAGALPNPTRFNNEPVTCPEGSKLGTVEATSPLLEEPLKGTVYLAAQEENPFDSLIAIYLVLESPRFGLTLKLPGKVETDPATGQVTATFDYVPQQPVEDLTLNFRGGGPHSEFATPEVCGTYNTKGLWTPWSAPESGPPAQTSDAFSVSTGCSASSATRPFAPSFEAGTTSPLAGSYSPLVIKVNRNDGEQELSRLNFTLPEGLVGNLASVPYCSEAAIGAARAKTGKAEQASPSCPASTQIGTVDAAAGVGSEPIHVGGRVYMAGPYEGAPLSTVVISPAVAGPFDLGDVVVRAPLFVDRSTAQVTAKSDPIPTVLRGIPLKVRSIAITIDRSGFTLNPTSCAAMSVAASIGSSDGATATPSNRFQVGGCANLPFRPALSATTTGKNSKANGAALVVKVATKPGDANIHKVNLQIPVKLPSRLTTLQKACSEEQFNANPAGCPEWSVIGTAIAHTPLLQTPLSGPVYLVSHGSAAFPDVEFVLQGDERGGDIEVIVDGNTQIKNGITYSHFETVPDVPVTSFEAVLPQGPHSILGVNLPASAHYDLCGQVLRMPTTLTGQNGAEVRQNTPITVEGCPTSLSFSSSIKRRIVTISAYAPAPGKLTASGKGLTTVSKSAKGQEYVTIKLKQKRAGRLRTKVKVSFTPSTGKNRKKQSKVAKLKFKK